MLSLQHFLIYYQCLAFRVFPHGCVGYWEKRENTFTYKTVFPTDAWVVGKTFWLPLKTLSISHGFVGYWVPLLSVASELRCFPRIRGLLVSNSDLENSIVVLPTDSWVIG